MEKSLPVINVHNIIQRDIAVSAEEGNKIYQRIIELFSQHETIILDFKGITLLTTAFLNAAIGQLYKTYTSEELNQRLKLQNVSQDDLLRFKTVIERAKEYFKDPKSFQETAEETFGA